MSIATDKMAVQKKQTWFQFRNQLHSANPVTRAPYRRFNGTWLGKDRLEVQNECHTSERIFPCGQLDHGANCCETSSRQKGRRSGCTARQKNQYPEQGNAWPEPNGHNSPEALPEPQTSRNPRRIWRLKHRVNINIKLRIERSKKFWNLIVTTMVQIYSAFLEIEDP
jgi:hypothetical protein